MRYETYWLEAEGERALDLAINLAKCASEARRVGELQILVQSSRNRSTFRRSRGRGGVRASRGILGNFATFHFMETL